MTGPNKLPMPGISAAVPRGRCVGSGWFLNNAEATCGRVGTAWRWVPCMLVVFGLLWSPDLRAQTPEEHASHHPGAPGAATAAGAMPATGGSPASEGMGGMGEMMKGMMGGAPPKELYPSLMEIPELSPEQRKQVEGQGNARMHAGSVLIGQALDSLNAATLSADYAAMHEATTLLREGTAQLESGIAARRALVEGRAPREVALTWFKREMNLQPALSPTEHDRPGLTIFHLFTMVLLIAFSLAMVAMYFFKMRRAAALFGRIETDKGTPPPGSSPPLAGGRSKDGDKPPGGNTPPGSNKPPAGDKPPSDDPSPPKGDAPPSSEESAPPLASNWRGQLRIGSIIQETPEVKTFRLLPATNGHIPFTFVPGQFLNVAFLIGGARMNRSYSISSSPTHRGHVDLTIKREPRGAVSRHIVDLLKVGDVIEAGGPVGNFTFDGTEAESVVLISAGVGITPMVSIARYLTERSWPGEIFFIYTCRTPADYILESEVVALQLRNPKLHVAVTLTRAESTDWKGPRGHLTKELLSRTVPDLATRRIHICGPQAMMDSTKALLAELGVPPEQVKSEMFGATKPGPTAAGTTAQKTAVATGPRVAFSKNGKSARIRTGQTVLELSEELGIGIENSCRVGTCGICKVKLTSGEVEMAIEDSLDANAKANGLILACQAIPKGEITVEA